MEKCNHTECPQHGTQGASNDICAHCNVFQGFALTAFIAAGQERGFIGLPCPDFFIGSMEGIDLEFQHGVNDVLTRCYWQDDEGNGGCISIPCDRLVLDSLSQTRRRIEDRLRKDWRFLKQVAALM